MQTFSLDKDIDFLSGATGTPRDEGFARIISVSDSLNFRAPCIPRIRREVLGNPQLLPQEGLQEASFGFVDHVRSISDPNQLKKLNSSLGKKLSKEQLDNIHMAPPEQVDWNHHDGFAYTQHGPRVAGLDPEEFLESWNRSSDLTADSLKRRSLFLFLDNTEKHPKLFSAYHRLVAYTSLSGQLYTISGGDWYELDKTFIEQSKNKLGRIREANLGLPKASVGQREDPYNKRAAKAPATYLLDRELIREHRSRLELCGLCTNKRQFIHVKKWDSSATPNHLFSQGIISA